MSLSTAVEDDVAYQCGYMMSSSIHDIITPTQRARGQARGAAQRLKYGPLSREALTTGDLAEIVRQAGWAYHEGLRAVELPMAGTA